MKSLLEAVAFRGPVESFDGLNAIRHHIVRLGKHGRAISMVTEVHRRDGETMSSFMDRAQGIVNLHHRMAAGHGHIKGHAPSVPRGLPAAHTAFRRLGGHDFIRSHHDDGAAHSISYRFAHDSGPYGRHESHVSVHGHRQTELNEALETKRVIDPLDGLNHISVVTTHGDHNAVVHRHNAARQPHESVSTFIDRVTDEVHNLHKTVPALSHTLPAMPADSNYLSDTADWAHDEFLNSLDTERPHGNQDWQGFHHPAKLMGDHLEEPDKHSFVHVPEFKFDF